MGAIEQADELAHSHGCLILFVYVSLCTFLRGQVRASVISRTISMNLVVCTLYAFGYSSKLGQCRWAGRWNWGPEMKSCGVGVSNCTSIYQLEIFSLQGGERRHWGSQRLWEGSGGILRRRSREDWATHQMQWQSYHDSHKLAVPMTVLRSQDFIYPQKNPYKLFQVQEKIWYNQ